MTEKSFNYLSFQIGIQVSFIKQFYLSVVMLIQTTYTF